MPLAHWSARQLPDLAEIGARLREVFPEGIEHRGWLTAERAAHSVFVFLYVFAVEGVSENSLRPAMVTTMSDQQARKRTEAQLLRGWTEACKPRAPVPLAGRWYAENTREPIRDETFRAFKQYGAVLEDPLPTTPARPRYRLAGDFADLLDPSLRGPALIAAIRRRQENHLPPAARARVALYQRTQTASAGATVRWPDGSSRVLPGGPSTPLLKATVEDFAPRLLRQPLVLALSQACQRILFEDREQFARIGLRPDPRIMPDVVMADLGWPQGTLQLILAECVATSGAMPLERAEACRMWLRRQGFKGTRLVLKTIFRDRGDPVFRSHVGQLAWGTFVWCATEPGHLMVLQRQGTFVAAASLDQGAETVE